MRIRTRLVIVGLLALIAVLILIPRDSASLQPIGTNSGPGIRYGVRVERRSGGPLTDAERSAVAAILRDRLAKAGLASAIVEVSDDPGETVAVSVSPSSEAAHAKRLLQLPGKIEVRAVVDEVPVGGFASLQEAESSPWFDPVRDEVFPYLRRDDRRDRSAGSQFEARFLVVERGVLLSNGDMHDASASPDEYSEDAGSNYLIDFTLETAAAERFGAWTERNISRDVAIVLDGQVRSAPRIQSRIGDRGQITGVFTKEQAEDLAAVLRSGQLPGPVTILSETPLGR